jgi:hypothetical protein
MSVYYYHKTICKLNFSDSFQIQACVHNYGTIRSVGPIDKMCYMKFSYYAMLGNVMTTEITLEQNNNI